VSDTAVDVNPGAGRASLVVKDLAMFDFFSIPNALFRFLSPASVPATVSFDLEWTGPVTQRRSISDPVAGFEGEFFATSAVMGWSAHTSTFSFTSDSASSSHSVAALLGNERNGRFFGRS
jgi:hypothetical protein